MVARHLRQALRLFHLPLRRRLLHLESARLLYFLFIDVLYDLLSFWIGLSLGYPVWVLRRDHYWFLNIQIIVLIYFASVINPCPGLLVSEALGVAVVGVGAGVRLLRDGRAIHFPLLADHLARR